MSAADLIAQARAGADLSQAELGRRAGLPRSVVNAYERGSRQPGADATIALLAAAGYELRLTRWLPLVRVLDDARADRILQQVLDLAEQLPFHRAESLGAPMFRRAHPQP